MSIMYHSLFPSLASCFVCFIVLLTLFEQIRYLRKKRWLPGPAMVVPFLGNAVSLVRDPTAFWDGQSATAKSSGLGFCADYIVGKFILFIRDTELSRKVFANVRPDAFALIGHPFGKKLFGDHNLIYMTGQDHKDLRRRIVPNFTPRALAAYTALQQIIILDHLEKWLRLSEASSSPITLRWLVRDMNLETSQTVFVGPYLAPESRERFKSDYNYFNVGLMKLPIDFPGTAFRNARLAVNRLIETLTVCAEKSREKMTASQAVTEPTCLVDFWVQENAKEAMAAEAAGLPAPANVADGDLGSYLFDFLFAAQDASTSSLLWAVALLDAHPDALRRVREEVSAVWAGEGAISAEMLAGFRYTHAVAREVVRLRAPATLVPHIAAEEFPLTEDYTVPKGTIVFPSTFESCLQGFTDSDRFDPDRFSDERQEDRVYKRNFLAFGAGAHQCVGQRYAMNHLVLFIAMFTALIDFERVRTDGCDEIVYVPTICPKDDCRVTLRHRCTRFPSLS